MPDETPTFSKVLIAALGKAQSEFPAVVKNKVNPFYNNAPYADLSAVFDATKNILFKNGITVTQLPVVQHNAENPLESLAGVNTILYHDSGEFISNQLLVPAKGKAKDGNPKYDAQTIGAALTYARRISYQSIVGVAAEDDDDGNAVSQDREYDQRPQPQRAPRPTPKPAPPARPQNEQQAPSQTVQPENLPPDPPAQQANVTPPATEEQYNAYLTRAKKLVKDLGAAGMKDSPGLTIGQKFKNFVRTTTGKELKQLTAKEWDDVLTLTEKVIEKKELDVIWKEETKADSQ